MLTVILLYKVSRYINDLMHVDHLYHNVYIEKLKDFVVVIIIGTFNIFFMDSTLIFNT